jgi:hypothetical protein
MVTKSFFAPDSEALKIYKTRALAQLSQELSPDSQKLLLTTLIKHFEKNDANLNSRRNQRLNCIQASQFLFYEELDTRTKNLYNKLSDNPTLDDL